MAISVNMLRLRVLSDAQPRSKNGQPAHSTTGVASSSCTQFDVCWPIQPMQVEQVAAHLEREHRRGQRQADPEAPRHVGELGIGPGIRGHHLRLERHAADRTGAGADLPDLGMHRAGVDGAGHNGLGGAARRDRDTLPDRRELLAASAAAEIVGLAVVHMAVLGGVRDRPSCRTPGSLTPSAAAARARHGGRDGDDPDMADMLLLAGTPGGYA